MIILDAIAVSFSIAGTFFLSVVGNERKYRLIGFVYYLVSNVLMVISFTSKHLILYIILQLFFLVFSGIGIVRNLKKD